MSSEAPVHSSAFRRRRFFNWFPLGLTYAFLYMGRYNLTVSKNALGDLMTKEDFGVIFAVGTVVYGFAFLINGPITDKIGGKKAILISTFGSAIANLTMGLYLNSVIGTADAQPENLRYTFSFLYATNMYFQSFGAVSIVKVNSHWFHVRERGGFSGIFGTMISSGIFLAFTVNFWILDAVANAQNIAPMFAAKWVFYTPAMLLAVMFVFELIVLKDTPGETAHEDFDTGDASSGEEGQDIPPLVLIKRILTNPIILTIAAIEFCTGVLRNGIMHWYPIYAKEVLVLPSNHYMRNGSWDAWYLIAAYFVVGGITMYLGSRSEGRRKAIMIISGALIALLPFFQGGWGGILMVAGVMGGNLAGWVSDLFFQSRRGPAAGGLYGALVVTSMIMFFVLGGTTNVVGWSGDKGTDQATILKKGDTIVAIAGQSEVKDWSDVSRAVRCIPATCEDSAKWDTVRCLCASNPKGTSDNLTLGTGTISATVMRDGKTTEIQLTDNKTSMRAGDARKLKAGPELTLSPIWLAIIIFFMSMAVIGTHGLLSGTATMDFGGRKGAATTVGLIDGFVYLGTAVQSISLGYLTSQSWHYWPIFLLPFGIIGFLLTLKIWNAKPKAAGGGH